MSSSSRARNIVVPLLLVVVFAATLFATVFPTRTWWNQRQDIDQRRDEIRQLELEAETLEARIAALRTPAEIERIARRDYGMIKPGEEAFMILPPAPPPVAFPDAWPFTSLADQLSR